MNALEKLKLFGLETIEVSDVIAKVSKFRGSDALDVETEVSLIDGELSIKENEIVPIYFKSDSHIDHEVQYRTDTNTVLVLVVKSPPWGGDPRLHESVGRLEHAGLSGMIYQLEELLLRSEIEAVA